MANNVNIPAVGTGDTTPKVSTDQVSADNSQVQNIQLTSVASGVLTRLGTAGSPLEVAIVGTVPISGAPTTVTANLGTIAGAATETTLAAVNTKLGSALPLPTGAATQTTLAAVLSALGTPLQAGGAVTANIGTSGSLALDATLTGGTQKTKLVDTGGTNVASVSAAGALKVDGSAVTQTVNGTVTANLGTIAGVATQTTLASLLAKTPALGTAGAAATDVISIQGISGGTAIPVSGGGTPTDQQVTQAFTSAITGTPITGLNGISTVVVEVITTGNTATGVSWGVQGSQDGTNWEPLPWMTAGALTYNSAGTGASNATGIYYWLATGFAQIRLSVGAISAGSFPTNMRTSSGVIAPRQTVMTIGSGSAVIGKVGIDQTTPGTTNLVAANNTQINGTALLAGNGVSGTGAQRVTIASDSTGQVTLAAGATVGITSISTPTTGGYSVTRVIAANSTNANFSKASAGQVFGWYLANAAAYTVFLKLYNKASAPTVGTDTPFLTIPVPAGGGANVEYGRGIPFSTGIAYAITKLVADSDTTVVAANDLVMNLLYA